MQLQDKYRIAILAAYALALHSLERFIPTPIPWLRFGFANIITLTSLILYGFNTAMAITLVRVIAGSLITGTFLGPAFVLSFSGGITSTLAMWCIYRATQGIFSPFGLSIAGAFFHNIAQLSVAYALFIQNIRAILIITPVIIFVGTITGAINGVATTFILKKLRA